MTRYIVSDRYFEVGKNVSPLNHNKGVFESVAEEIRKEQFPFHPSRTLCTSLLASQEMAKRFARIKYSSLIGETQKHKIFYIYEVYPKSECWMNKNTLDILKKSCNIDSFNKEELVDSSEQFWNNTTLVLMKDSILGFTAEPVEIISRTKYVLDNNKMILKLPD